MPRLSVRNPQSRVYRHTVKRQLEATETLPLIQEDGFTIPVETDALLVPPEFDTVQAFETKAVTLVVLAVLRGTMGTSGDGPMHRQEWVKYSLRDFADVAHTAVSTIGRGIQEALRKGYLVRRPSGRTWAYSVRWIGMPSQDLSPRIVSPSFAKKRFAVMKRDNYRCQLCGCSAQDGPDVRLHVDHKIALADGGTNDMENLWTLCAPCNLSKGTQPL